MRKSITAFLSLVCILSLVGCGNEITSEEVNKGGAMRRQIVRPKGSLNNNSTQNGWNKSEKESDDLKERNLETAELIGESLGISKNQVRRYIRLTELLPELLDLVDKKRLQFTCAVDISYFDKTIQKWLNEYIRENVVIKPIQIAMLREIVSQENIDQDRMICILNENLPGKATSKKVISCIKELEEKVGLIERKKQGFGKPDLIYVKNFKVKEKEKSNEEGSVTDEKNIEHGNQDKCRVEKKR